MSALKITAQDVENLKAVEAAFSKGVIANYKAETQGDALAVFNENLTIKDKAKIAGSLLRAKWAKAAAAKSSPEKQARALLGRCTAVLPTMKRSFGEDLLVRSLPQEAKDPRVADICKALGAPGIADLCEKAQKLPAPKVNPPTPPAGPKA
ncbi:MAG: hypothetical protein GC185_13505 [Alphaproteobacteria bacterium]|nr:hypothetical protein [Alphaproteobacteria bacterium]